MSKRTPPNPHGIENEPHLRGEAFTPDPSEERAASIPSATTENELVEHNVWDEPGLSAEMSGGPGPDAVSYAGWYRKRFQETTFMHRWAVVLVVALCAGPFAIFGVFWEVGSGGIGVMGITVLGPAIEETLKVALVMWLVEKRPYLFAGKMQILICGLAGGLAFAVIENFMYLYVYIPDPSAEIIWWRWTVCVMLHTGCSSLAAWGLAREWERAHDAGTRPKMSRSFPFLVAAMVCHGLYNGSMVLLNLAGWSF